MNTSVIQNPDSYIQELVAHLLSAGTPDEMGLILNDLLTDTEIDEISKRLQIFKLLKTGMPQRQIAESLGVGIATVTRGSRALKSKTERI
ncbi:MAG: trp operon repressor [Agarilytica sp.]